jgi:hypothetical protein
MQVFNQKKLKYLVMGIKTISLFSKLGNSKWYLPISHIAREKNGAVVRGDLFDEDFKHLPANYVLLKGVVSRDLNQKVVKVGFYSAIKRFESTLVKRDRRGHRGEKKRLKK